MKSLKTVTIPAITRTIAMGLSLTLIACGGGTDSNGSFLLDGHTNRIAESDLTTEGMRTETGTGFISEGQLTLNSGDQATVFEKSVLEVEVDDNGTVVEMKGSTNVPTTLSNDVIVEGNVKSILDMMTGAEANLIDEIDIWLKEDRMYFIYYVGSEFKLIHTGIDGVEGTTVTLTPPLGGSILLISDPTDSFFYTQAASDIFFGYGAGDSVQGFIPYVPDLPYAELDMFDGHDIEKVDDYGIGIKAFDAMSVSGTKIIRSVQKLNVDLDGALEPQLEYKAGFNGSTKVALSVFGVGFFEFDVGQFSATIGVTESEQKMAMQTIIEPDVSWAPSWLPIVPSSRTQGEWMIDGSGRFEANLESTYISTLPQADLSGSMRLNNDSAVFAGKSGSGQDALGVKATFANETTSVDVQMYVNFDSGIKDGVLSALDRELGKVKEWTAKLQKRTANYDLEVSLNGLRVQLPVIADAAIKTLNGIPSTVRESVRSQVRSTLDNHNVLKNLSSNKRKSIASELANSAKNSAQTKANSMIIVMQNLKFQAQQGDDEALRAALQASLEAAYKNRTFSQKYTLKKKIGIGIGIEKEYTLYSKKHSYTVIPTAKANKINEASKNVHKITETSDLKIEAETILGDLREEETINQVKADVEDGISTIPSFDGLGYQVYRGQYAGYILLDGTPYSTEVNALDKNAIANAIHDQMAAIVSPNND